MADARALVGLFVDFAGFRQGLSLSSDEQDETQPTIRETARMLRQFASGAGRIGLAQAYADWSLDPDASKELVGTGIAPVLVPATAQGEDRSHIRLTIDAIRALYEGDEPDAFVLVSGEPALVPLMQILRAEGCEVIVVTPDVAASSEDTAKGSEAEESPWAELAAEADQRVSLHQILEGTVLEPVILRPARAAARIQGSIGVAPVAAASVDRGVRFASPGNRAGESRMGQAGHGAGSYGDAEYSNGYSGGGYDSSRGRGQNFDRPARHAYTADAFFDGPPEPDFANYIWGPFIRLIDELEERLPFVGVRYLVNKVLGPHNCGIDDPRQKRNLINQAVDEGIIEMYSVGNVDDRLDPVTACRLDRRNAVVEESLGDRVAFDDGEFEDSDLPLSEDDASYETEQGSVEAQ